MYEVRQKISNHPVLTDLERDVVVYRTADNMDVKQMPISAKIEHFKDVDGERTLLPEFTREVKDWIVSNDYEIKKRDENNEPILDEDGNTKIVKESKTTFLENIMNNIYKIGFFVILILWVLGITPRFLIGRFL